MSARKAKDKTIDELVDEGVDMTPYIVESSISFPGQDETVRKVNISMPAWMVDELDAIASHLAVSRQSVINMWLGERLKQERTSLSV